MTFALLLAVALLAATLPLPARASESTPRPRTDVERAIEAHLFAYHNLARTNPAFFGYADVAPAPVLAWSEEIANVARAWSDEMIRSDTYFHNPSWYEQLTAALPATIGGGENILMGHYPHAFPAPAQKRALGHTQGWMDSEGHRLNIMDPHHDAFGIGVSIDKNGWVKVTVNFVDLRDAPRTSMTSPVPAARNFDRLCPTPVGPGRFADVSGAELTHAVECLANLQVTSGVAPGRFDPDATVTRGQMAAFLVRALDSAGAPLPQASGRFSDVAATSTHRDAIGRLTAARIVSGRTNGTYGPGDPVLRGHIAKFLVTSYEHATGRPLPYAALGRFTDDDTSVFEHFIRQVSEQGWDVGRGPTRFAPNEPLTRGEMALALARWLAQLSEPT